MEGEERKREPWLVEMKSTSMNARYLASNRKKGLVLFLLFTLFNVFVLLFLDFGAYMIFRLMDFLDL